MSICVYTYLIFLSSCTNPHRLRHNGILNNSNNKNNKGNNDNDHNDFDNYKISSHPEK